MYQNLTALLARINGTVPYFGAVLTDVNQRGAFDDTPLSVVITWGDVEAVTMLLEAGADPNAILERETTTLEHAVMMGNGEVARLLLEAGATTNVNDSPTLIELARSAEVADLLSRWNGRKSG